MGAKIMIELKLDPSERAILTEAMALDRQPSGYSLEDYIKYAAKAHARVVLLKHYSQEKNNENRT